MFLSGKKRNSHTWARLHCPCNRVWHRIQAEVDVISGFWNCSWQYLHGSIQLFFSAEDNLHSLTNEHLLLYFNTKQSKCHTTPKRALLKKSNQSKNETSATSRCCMAIMRGSRKFCQRGSNFDNVVLFCVDEGREDPSTTISYTTMTFRWRADDGPTLNAGLVAAIFQGIRTCIARKPYIFVIFQGGPDPLAPSGSAHAHIWRQIWIKQEHKQRRSYHICSTHFNRNFCMLISHFSGFFAALLQNVCGEAMFISLNPMLAEVALAASHPRPLLGFSNPITERDRGPQ